MPELYKAIRYRSLDEARQVLAETGRPELAERIFDDQGEEPQGLLSVIPQDRLPEEAFYGLFTVRKGTVVEVEKIPYSGFGPPAEEQDYMGFTGEQTAYVLTGCRYPIEIENCPQGARDLHHLEALILDGHHPIDRHHLAQRLGLGPNWDFEDLFDLIAQGELTAQEVDRLIHAGIQ